MLLRIVVAIADDSSRWRARRLLRQVDAAVEVVKGKKALWDRAARTGADILLVGEGALPPRPAEAIEHMPRALERPMVVVVSEHDSPLERAALLAAGCEAVLSCSLPDEVFLGALEAILGRRRSWLLATRASRKPLSTPRLSDFVSESPTMQQFMDVVHSVVGSQSSLLILGETGVGKERLARAVHAEGPRAEGPFVAVNCGALPESLLESELFGHEEGAFTGATRARKGAFELAHTGTIFLDEVADMPLHLQVKLLRVLQDHELQRIGGERPFTVDVRVVAASNRELEDEVAERRFRKDLYYRLSVICLTVPPLRDRREDIPVLVHSYLGYLRPRVGREVGTIAPEALDALSRYDWPGNVRELINVIERAMLLSRDGSIGLPQLPAVIANRTHTPPLAAANPVRWLSRPLRQVKAEVYEQVERGYLQQLLTETGGRVGETAKRAGLAPRSLYAKMRQYGLRKEDYRSRAAGRRDHSR
jgi:DNA-binding NtrC family response regulator